MRRPWLLVPLLVVALASPASAHEEIIPNGVPVGRPAFLSLGAANERRVNLTRLTLTAPSGVAFGDATRDPTGWRAARTDTAVTWTGGVVEPGRFELFGFEIEGVDQPGNLSYKVALAFADGSSEDATVVLTAAGAGASAAAAPASGPTTAPAAGEAEDAAGEAEDADGSGNGLAIVALVASVAALALAGFGLARSRAAAPAPGAGPAQDW
jgi:hypothetical protein